MFEGHKIEYNFTMNRLCFLCNKNVNEKEGISLKKALKDDDMIEVLMSKVSNLVSNN